jgi:hypothetical protein
MKRGDEDMDLSYYQLKELKKSLPKTAMFTCEYANCYGKDMNAIRQLLVDSKCLAVVGKFAKESGVLTLKMISEIILLLCYE